VGSPRRASGLVDLIMGASMCERRSKPKNVQWMGRSARHLNGAFKCISKWMKDGGESSFDHSTNKHLDADHLDDPR